MNIIKPEAAKAAGSEANRELNKALAKTSDSGANLRIVSLIPSATEIVAALGYGDYLVGRSHECDYPSSVKGLPICTEPKFDPTGTSSQIHERVTELLASALSVYRVNTSVIAQLRPTHIITQAQCEVCAVSLSDVEQAVNELMAEGDGLHNIQIVSLQPMQLDDVWDDMARVAAALEGSTQDKNESKERISLTINELKQRLQPIEVTEPRPSVACIEWTEPLMAAGNWVPELVSWAGGTDCFGKVGTHSDWMTWEALLAADPDIIVVMPCGYDMAQTREAAEELATHEQWSQLKAVSARRVYLTDGNQYFNRPGPRLVESGEILREIIQEKAVDSARSSVGWERL